jgi:hypothetical protein
VIKRSGARVLRDLIRHGDGEFAIADLPARSLVRRPASVQSWNGRYDAVPGCRPELAIHHAAIAQTHAGSPTGTLTHE